jgi:putative peptidoglycan lipid II flippase
MLRHTILFSLFVLLAQFFGLVRDLYLAKIFGVGEILDIYYMAFKIPDFLNVFYSVFLGSVIFIPLLTKLKHEGGEETMQKKINSVGSLVLFSLTFIFIILEIFMPQLTKLLVPTWSEENRSILTDLSRILLFAQFLFPIGILGGSIGMVYGKPLGMAISGFIYNLGILLAAFLLVPIFGVYGLAWSVIFGALLFMLVQIWNIKPWQFIKSFRIKVNFSEWGNFIKENLGRLVAVFSYQLYGIIILSIAAFSGPGGVASFSIAYNLYLAAFFVLGASFSTVLMPSISDTHVKGDKVLQKKNLRKSLLIIFALSLIAGLVLFFASFYIVKILYFFSDISLEKEIYIASLLSLLAISFPFINILEVIRKYLYATSQIFFAGVQTVIMLLGVAISTYILNSLPMAILISLILSINISMFLTTFISLFWLRIKDEI